jgi:hypothetical protein
MWQDLLKNKYLRSKSPTQAKVNHMTLIFWRGLMRIKDEVLTNGSFIIRDGSTTRFWEDKWAGSVSLRERYPSLFNIVRDPHALVANKILATHPLNISFRGTLLRSKLTDWSNLVAQISLFSLVDGSDTFRQN